MTMFIESGVTALANVVEQDGQGWFQGHVGASFLAGAVASQRCRHGLAMSPRTIVVWCAPARKTPGRGDDYARAGFRGMSARRFWLAPLPASDVATD
ncbi:hypothetical protein [Dickeya fangzhongdai]